MTTAPPSALQHKSEGGVNLLKQNKKPFGEAAASWKSTRRRGLSRVREQRVLTPRPAGHCAPRGREPTSGPSWRLATEAPGIRAPQGTPGGAGPAASEVPRGGSARAARPGGGRESRSRRLPRTWAAAPHPRRITRSSDPGTRARARSAAGEGAPAAHPPPQVAAGGLRSGPGGPSWGRGRGVGQSGGRGEGAAGRWGRGGGRRESARVGRGSAHCPVRPGCGPGAGAAREAAEPQSLRARPRAPAAAAPASPRRPRPPRQRPGGGERA